MKWLHIFVGMSLLWLLAPNPTVSSNTVIRNNSVNIGETNIGRSAHTGSIVIDQNEYFGTQHNEEYGPIKKENRNLEYFDQISINVAADILIRNRNPAKVTLHAQEHILPILTTDIEQQKLVIGVNQSFNATAPIKIVIDAPSIRSILLNGSGEVKLKNMDGKHLEIRMAGTGDLWAEGSVTTLVVSLEGSGDINTSELLTDHATVRLSGTGKIKVHAQQRLDSDIQGVGQIVYYGSPSQVNKSINGVGQIIPIGAN